MAGMIRSRSAVALVGASAALALSLSGMRGEADRVRGAASLGRIVEKTEGLGRRMCPGIRKMLLEPAPFTVYRYGRIGVRFWTVQILDDYGTYIGTTVWDANTGYLASATWRDRTPAAATTTAIPNREAGEFARLALIQMNVSPVGSTWRTLGKPERVRNFWIVRLSGPTGQYRVKLDSVTGQLVGLERQ